MQQRYTADSFIASGFVRAVRVKRWGKSPPGLWRHRFYDVNSIRSNAVEKPETPIQSTSVINQRLFDVKRRAFAEILCVSQESTTHLQQARLVDERRGIDSVFP